LLLTDEEKRMLAGEYGPGVQRAIDLLVKLGDSFGAERMARISYGNSEYDTIEDDFWDFITEDAKPLAKVTTMPAHHPEHWKEWGITSGTQADEFIAKHQKKLDTVRRLGWLLTETCAAYLLGIIPGKGEIVAMGGSCMQVTNNSLFGARVDRAGDLCSLASCICGRIPVMGLMLPENRYAHILAEVDNLDVTDWTYAHYSSLGYYVGQQVSGFKNIAVTGLPPNIPFDMARALVIPLPISGAIALCHIVGSTPEAPTLEEVFKNTKPEQIVKVGKRELSDAWESLNVWDNDRVEHVAFGCPHCTIDELGQIAALLESKTLKASLLIGASVSVEALARRQGYTEIIEKSGGHFLPCCPAIFNPFTNPNIAGERKVKSAATDSARAAHFIARVSGAKTFFGTKKECIDAAISGIWKGEQPKWK